MMKVYGGRGKVFGGRGLMSEGIRRAVEGGVWIGRTVQGEEDGGEAEAFRSEGGGPSEREIERVHDPG
jgi:hypothetical protein